MKDNILYIMFDWVPAMAVFGPAGSANRRGVGMKLEVARECSDLKRERPSIQKTATA